MTCGTYLAAQYQRFHRRFGKKGEAKAIFAVAHTILVVVWEVLAHDAVYFELGSDYFTRRSGTQAHARRLARQIEKLGYHITLESADAA